MSAEKEKSAKRNVFRFRHSGDIEVFNDFARKLCIVARLN